MFNDTVKVFEALIFITGATSLFWVLFKGGTTKATIQSQRELIGTLTTQVKELRTLHIDNTNAIAELRGQVSVYKELPLSDMAKNMKVLAETQDKILKKFK